jgi:hypothetical protein
VQGLATLASAHDGGGDIATAHGTGTTCRALLARLLPARVLLLLARLRLLPVLLLRL